VLIIAIAAIDEALDPETSRRRASSSCAWEGGLFFATAEYVRATVHERVGPDSRDPTERPGRRRRDPRGRGQRAALSASAARPRG
jgi:hypothetical protein